MTQKTVNILGDGCQLNIGIIISQYIQILNHDAVHLKLIQLYVNYISITMVGKQFNGGRIAFKLMVLEQLDMRKRKMNLDLNHTSHKKLTQMDHGLNCEM